MPELGDTADPAALVPGDPGALFETAWSLRVYADVLGEAAAGLGRIGAPAGWSGTAAEEFRSRFGVEPARWAEAAECHRTAADAVEAHAAVLAAAQRQAADAVRRGEAGQQDASALLVDARRRVQEAGDRAAADVAAARDRAPEAAGFLADLASGAGTVAAQLGNAAASLGYAALRNPLDGAAIVGGGALAAVSAVGVAGGAGLTLTGPGAVVGVPLGTVSAAGVVTGAGLAGLGAIDLALHASGPDRVQPFQVNEETEPVAPPPFPPPREITGWTKHGEQQAGGRDGNVGVSDEAVADAVANPVKPPEYRPNGTYRYTGQDAIVSLNERGEVVTTWATSSRGWRNK